MKTVSSERRKFSPLPFSPLPQPFLPLFTLFPCFKPSQRTFGICGTGLFLFNSSCAHSPHTGLVKFAQSDKVVSQAWNKTIVIFTLLKWMALDRTSNYLWIPKKRLVAWHSKVLHTALWQGDAEASCAFALAFQPLLKYDSTESSKIKKTQKVKKVPPRLQNSKDPTGKQLRGFLPVRHRVGRSSLPDSVKEEAASEFRGTALARTPTMRLSWEIGSCGGLHHPITGYLYLFLYGKYLYT